MVTTHNFLVKLASNPVTDELFVNERHLRKIMHKNGMFIYIQRIIFCDNYSVFIYLFVIYGFQAQQNMRSATKVVD
jgi:hypothetical protein